MKSTGGKSIKMPPPKPKSTRAIQDVEMHSVQSLEPLRRQPERAMAKLADWCYSCMDGRDLIACDLCERLICTMRCLELPISFTDLEKSAYRFENVKSLVLLHFTLETISTAGSPASMMVYQFLQPFFTKGSLLFQEVKFNIYNKDDAGIHADRMEDLARIISKKHDGTPVWLFITTHGDQERGNLFYNTKAANYVDSFFDTVLTESVMNVLQTRNTTCFMMVCGGLVTFPDSQRDLCKIFNSCKFKHLFAFTVEGLIPSLLSSLILDMTQRVIVESYDVSDFIGNLIASSPITGRHMSIVHLSITTEGMKSVQYVWAHKTMQPWGK
ncbi:hypothetical protein BJV77DRAFT_1068791 [Russula vinacea]|nr:hypothetical protein BJV77DRAFT_1068791 [Russula vinacea]